MVCIYELSSSVLKGLYSGCILGSLSEKTEWQNIEADVKFKIYLFHKLKPKMEGT